MRKIVVGVMGGAEVSKKDMEDAYELGRLIAQKGWVMLNGGRGVGVMEASARGAADAGGLTVGILPDRSPHGASPSIDIVVLTGMGDARNVVNVLSSDVVIACPGGAGTLSEVALALKNGRPAVLLNFDPGPVLSGYASQGLLFAVKTPTEAVRKAEEILRSR